MWYVMYLSVDSKNRGLCLAVVSLCLSALLDCFGPKLWPQRLRSCRGKTASFLLDRFMLPLAVVFCVAASFSSDCSELVLFHSPDTVASCLLVFP